jgi:hypothetical protein
LKELIRLNMRNSKLPLLFEMRLSIVTVGISLFGISSLLISPAALADPSPEATRIPFQYQLTNDPPDRGTPPTQGGTGSRGNCLHNPQRSPLTPITGGDRLDLTTSEHPTVWIYLPYSAEDAPVGEFSLQDDEDEVYRTQFAMPSSPGVVGVTVSATNELELGKHYRWYLEVDCPRATVGGQSEPATLTGTVQRVARSADLDRQLQIATTAVQRASAYASQGIWYDTITELAQLRLQEPDDASATQLWVELLSNSEIGLESVAREAIVGHVTTSSPPE